MILVVFATGIFHYALFFTLFCIFVRLRGGKFMILEAKQRDSDYFKKVFDRYAKPMFLYALSFVDTEGEAEDMVQDIFYNYWKTNAWREVDETVVKTYLFRSVKNAGLNHIQKKNVLRGSMDIFGQTLAEEEYEEFDETLVEKIRRDIEEMPPQTREIIKAVFYRNQKYQEVADQLGVSLNTVKTLLRRAMHVLRERYADYLFFFLCLLADVCL